MPIPTVTVTVDFGDADIDLDPIIAECGLIEIDSQESVDHISELSYLDEPSFDNDGLPIFD